jgi:hypothetical protein
MLALIGAVLAIIAGICKLIPTHTTWIVPLLIVAVILIGLDVAYAWHRGGYYRRA